jgi:hypothetical protein
MLEAWRKYPELGVQQTPNRYLIPNLQYQRTHSKLGFDRTRFPRRSEGERLIWLEEIWLSKLDAMRKPGESYTRSRKLPSNLLHSSGGPALRRPSKIGSSWARYVGSSVLAVREARTREMAKVGLSARPPANHRSRDADECVADKSIACPFMRSCWAHRF